MPYSAFDLATVKTRLEQAQLASYIYQHQQQQNRHGATIVAVEGGDEPGKHRTEQYHT